MACGRSTTSTTRKRFAGSMTAGRGRKVPATVRCTLLRPVLPMQRGVPAEVCENRGEEYLDEATTAHPLRTADAAAQAGVHVEIRDYLAA